MNTQIVEHINFPSTSGHGNEALDPTDENYPKGVFQYRNIENEYDTNMKLPKLDQINLNPMSIVSNLFDAALQATSRDQHVYGVKLPLPFDAKTLNLQFTREKATEAKGRREQQYSGENTELEPAENDAKSEDGDADTSDMDKSSKAALNMARLACLNSDRNTCDQALERYFQVRYHISPMRDALAIKRSEPRDLDGIISTGLAKWMLPSLKHSLNNMVLGKHKQLETDSANGTPDHLKDYGTSDETTSITESKTHNIASLSANDDDNNTNDSDDDTSDQSSDDGARIRKHRLMLLPVRSATTNTDSMVQHFNTTPLNDNRRQSIKLPPRNMVASSFTVIRRQSQKTMLPNRDDVVTTDNVG